MSSFSPFRPLVESTDAYVPNPRVVLPRRCHHLALPLCPMRVWTLTGRSRRNRLVECYGERVRLNGDILRRLGSQVKNVIDSGTVKGSVAARNVSQSVVNLTTPFAFFQSLGCRSWERSFLGAIKFPGLFRRSHEYRQRQRECPNRVQRRLQVAGARR